MRMFWVSYQAIDDYLEGKKIEDAINYYRKAL